MIKTHKTYAEKENNDNDDNWLNAKLFKSSQSNEPEGRYTHLLLIPFFYELKIAIELGLSAA